jgi:hypothetical protein
MAKYKVLKSVAHNLGHSFLSDSNAAGDPWTYVAPQLYQNMKRQGLPKVTIDFLAQTVTPAAAATPLVIQSVGWYQTMLERMLKAERLDLASLTSATLELAFDLENPLTPPGPRQADEIPSFECDVRLVDDRGKVHLGRPVEWLG